MSAILVGSDTEACDGRAGVILGPDVIFVVGTGGLPSDTRGGAPKAAGMLAEGGGGGCLVHMG